ncbi:methyltransferase [Clostridia bacterium]|nr:methyltransferase [Clostridia bacterium]
MEQTTRFEKVNIDELVPYARNARTHSKEQILQLRSSLREFGFVNPIIVDKELNIIAGHGRVEAAKAEGMTEVPCVFAEHLTDAQKKAYIIADNRLTMSAGWDEELLALEFGELKELGFDLELTGFGADEIEKLFADVSSDVTDDDFDLTAALEAAAFVLPGDVWTLGRHRLICGDATDADTVKKLMDGRKANLVLTDPPYNVDFSSASGLSIKNDKMADDKFYSFLLSSFQNLADNLEGGGSAYIFHADTEGENFRRAFREAGFHLSGTCIWAKDSFVMGRSPYQWQHEPILYGWLKSGKHKWYAGRSEATVWNFAKPKRNADHPTSKPLELLAYPIKNSSQANGIVLDTFGGSGSTLIACEQADRICNMLELDEKYASVILRRYAEFKQNGGEDITCERDGKTLNYKDLAKEVCVKLSN